MAQVLGVMLADVSKIVDLEAHRFFDLIYTESFDKFIIEKGYLAHVEKISYEEKDNKIYKRVRVSPAIPVAIRNMAHNYMGGVTVTYEDVSVKHLDSLMIEFKIENVPVVGQYADTAKGKIVVVPVDDGHCKLEIYFDLRISYPVIGYYIAQVIRSQVLHDIGAWPELVMEYVGRQN